MEEKMDSFQKQIFKFFSIRTMLDEGSFIYSFFSSFSGEKLLSIFQLKSVSFAFSRFIHPANCQILQFEYRPMP